MILGYEFLRRKKIISDHLTSLGYNGFKGSISLNPKLGGSFSLSTLFARTNFHQGTARKTERKTDRGRDRLSEGKKNKESFSQALA